MRIALVMTALGAGGVQQTLIQYACALREAGHELLIIMSHRSPLLQDIRSQGFYPELVWFPNWPTALRVFHAMEVRRKLLRFKPDAVIGLAAKGYVEARMASREKAWPIFTYVGSMQSRRIKPLLSADGWIATSTEMSKLLMELAVPSEQIRIVHNFLPSSEMTAPRLRLNQPCRIGSLGRLMDRKGYHVLIDAIAELKRRGKPVKCLIGGSGPKERELRKQIAGTGLANDVVMTGWIRNDQKRDFLGGIDIFVSPSLDEPFGIVFLEAMQAGLPIVASNTVGAREIFTHRENALIVKVNDPQELADAIESLIEDHELAALLAREASELFKSTYHISVAAIVFDEAIKGLTAAHSLNCH